MDATLTAAVLFLAVHHDNPAATRKAFDANIETNDVINYDAFIADVKAQVVNDPDFQNELAELDEKADNDQKSGVLN